MTNEEKKYKLTPYGCLYAVCLDYGIDISHLTQKMGEHFYEDFMETLCKNGYVGRKEVEEDE